MSLRVGSPFGLLVAITKPTGNLTQTTVGRIVATKVKTQPSNARVASIVTKTQGVVAEVTTGVTSGVIFHDACNTSANYTTVGSNTTFGGNNGLFGTLGASGSMHINFSGGAYVFEGAQKTLTGTATIFQLYARVATTATLGTGNTLFTVYTGSTFTGGTAPIRVDITNNGTTDVNGVAQFRLTLMDPSAGFPSITRTSTTLISLGQAFRINLAQTSAGWSLFINNQTTAEYTYSHTQATVGFANISFGTLYQNPSGSLTGVVDIDEIWCGNLNTTPTTTSGKAYDAYQGYLLNHLSADGQPYRGPSDGDNLSGVTDIDTVSEDVGYLLKLAVQNNDQASFILTDNWVLNNLLRSNSTTGNTQNNAAPTNALNLMAFHYNSANTDGKGIGTIYDANWAGDAENDRAQALLWAHARFGSSAYTVGTTNELVTPNYKQRALNVISDLRNYAFVNSTSTGYNYLVADSFQQGNSVVQIAPDYNAPAAYELFGQYDITNRTFWLNAISGSYDIITKAANTIFSGQTTTAHLNTDWVAFTVSTATVSTTAASYGDFNYGYNAFRIYSRLYNMYTWYADTSALTALQLPKSFFTSTWASTGYIPATFNHDGTNAAGYENTAFTYAAYFTIYANDTGNTTASAINSGKLSNLYYQEPYGSIISESPTSAYYGYFGQSWTIENYMEQNGLWTNYGQQTFSTVTKTQPTNSRIQVTATKTQTTIGRIAKVFTKTQGTNGRVVATVVKTQPSNGRVSSRVTKTITTDGSVQLIRVLTQPANGRVAKSFTKAQGVDGSVSIPSTTSTTVIGRVAIIPSLTQPVNGRVAETVTKTQGTNARVAKITVKTTTTVARIIAVATKTQPVNGRINITGVTTQTTIARVSKSLNKTQPSNARLAKTSVATQVTDGVVKAANATTQGVRARVSSTVTKAQTVDGVIRATATKTQLTNARLVKTGVKTQTVDAKVSGSNTRQQVVDGDIRATVTKAQGVKARLQIAGSMTVGTPIGILVSNTRSYGIVTQFLIARVSSTRSITQPVDATLNGVAYKTQVTAGRIQRFRGLTQNVVGRIQAAAPITKTQGVVARIITTKTKTQGVNGRVQIIGGQSTGTYGGGNPIGILVSVTQGYVYGVTRSTTNARVAKQISLTQGVDATIVLMPVSTQHVNARVSSPVNVIQVVGGFVTPNAVRGGQLSGLLLMTQPPSTLVAIGQYVNGRVQTFQAASQNVDAFVAAPRSKTTHTIGRISATVTKTQGVDATIRASVTKVQTLHAYVTDNLTKQQNIKARVVTTVSAVQPTNARLVEVRSIAQTVIARLVKLEFATQGVNARLTETVTKATTVIGRIEIRLSKTQSVKANLNKTLFATQPVDAGVANEASTTQPTGGTLLGVAVKTQPVNGRVFNSVIITRTALKTNRRTVNLKIR